MRKVSQLLIGSTIKIEKARNKTLMGLRGRVIDETKNLFVVETRKGIKKIIKKQIKFKVENGKRKERK